MSFSHQERQAMIQEIEKQIKLFIDNEILTLETYLINMKKTIINIQSKRKIGLLQVNSTPPTVKGAYRIGGSSARPALIFQKK